MYTCKPSTQDAGSRREFETILGTEQYLASRTGTENLRKCVFLDLFAECVSTLPRPRALISPGNWVVAVSAALWWTLPALQLWNPEKSCCALELQVPGKSIYVEGSPEPHHWRSQPLPKACRCLAPQVYSPLSCTGTELAAKFLSAGLGSLPVSAAAVGRVGTVPGRGHSGET